MSDESRCFAGFFYIGDLVRMLKWADEIMIQAPDFSLVPVDHFLHVTMDW